MTHPAFEKVRAERIPSLALTMEEYRHGATGASHIHLDSDDDNNAFLVALRTVPSDSTGVAHILEHVSLCGSERYPVRDPFFMMLRRSLNTFMNAFTASDWTAYPFATQNRKDFENLLGVYLDAVFFPRLEPLDFAQEGHRLEFEEPGNPGTPLVIRGVVYNEMKGAMSAPVAQVAQTLQSHLFPTITYHYNSGGEPERIPELGYEQLKAFHARHYHPSNAVFMTYGNFPVEEHHSAFENLVLGRFGREELTITISDERRFPRPVAVSEGYSLDATEDPKRKTHVVMGWLLGKSTDLSEMLRAHVMSGVLLDNSASPLRKMLETTELGSAPSELCGLDDSTREASFVCGLEGTEAEHAPRIEGDVLAVLERVASEGVPTEQVESVLHQVELAQREVGGGRFPYGLRLMTRVLPAFLHGGDPLRVLDIDDALDAIRSEIRDPDFIKQLVRRLLLDNPHRVRLTMTPDTELAGRRESALAERLASRKEAMDEKEKSELVKLAAALKVRQEAEEDMELLPKVGIGDVPADRAMPDAVGGRVDGMPLAWYAQGTNGLVYQQLVVDLPQLEQDLVDLLPLYCDCVAEVGCADSDYLRMQARQAAVSGGVSAHVSLRPRVDDLGRVHGAFVLASKALARNQEALAELLRDILTGARFDELARLRDLVAQLHAQEQASLTQRGHVLAMSAASAGLSPGGGLHHRWYGLEALKRLKVLDAALEERGPLEALAANLARLRDILAVAPRQLLAVGEGGQQDSVRRGLELVWSEAGLGNGARSAFAWDCDTSRVHEGWSVNTQVNFCATAYATVPEGHADAAPLMVLGPFLTDGFLHRAIREQGGAYGGGAGYSADSGALRFYSYRDPRLAETLADFRRAVDWLHEESHEPRQLEEAILRVVSDIDRPESPAGEALADFFGSLHGRSPDHRRALRRAVLQVTLDDLRRVGGRYLVEAEASTAVVGNDASLERAGELGLQIRRL